MTRRSYLAGATMLAIAAAGLAPLSVAGSQSPAAATARTVPALFGTASATAQRTAPDLSLGAAKRSRYVSFRAGVLPRTAAGQRISLGFFKDASFIGNVEHVDRQPLLTSWSGPLNSQYGTFVVTKSGDRYSVMASTTSGSYSMSMTRSGSYQVEEVSPPHLTGEDESTPRDAGGSAKAAVERTKKVRGGDDGSVEDILVIYTPSAAAAYGGVAGINAEAAKNIGYTNAAYASSGVHTSARLVGVLPTASDDSPGGILKDIGPFTQRGDGRFDEVFKDVEKTHADDSILLEGPPPASAPVCGVANLSQHQPANAAFGVVSTGDCTNAFPSFPHELGHNQGATHDKYTVNSGAGGSAAPPEFPYGYGYVAPNFAFHTVMAYDNQCIEVGGFDCPAIFYFSNPAVGYGGQPTGTTSTNDVAKLISKTRKTVARHQQSTLYPRGKKVAIKPKPRVGQRVHVTFTGWINGGVHTKFQWYRNGKKIKHARAATYRPTRKDAGKQLSVVVKGKKKYYTPVLIGTNARKVKGPVKKHGHHRAGRATTASPASLVVVPSVRVTGWI